MKYRIYNTEGEVIVFTDDNDIVAFAISKGLKVEEVQ